MALVECGDKVTEIIYSLPYDSSLKWYLGALVIEDDIESEQQAFVDGLNFAFASGGEVRYVEYDELVHQKFDRERKRKLDDQGKSDVDKIADVIDDEPDTFMERDHQPSMLFWAQKSDEAVIERIKIVYGAYIK